ncbi:MAG: flagellar biosynthesis protein FlhA [Phycisphaerales bacterium]|nr:flagellar biosynthesis protein FlhA [Phycisphaerales bacterium]
MSRLAAQPGTTRSDGFNDLLDRIGRHKHLIVPLAILMLLTVLVVPLPPAILDVLIAANIALASVILLTTVYMDRPLEFSVFPALLLGATLFRLVLNVASTRLILNADAPTPDSAMYMAGNVIEAFGTFVAGTSVIVGIIIFTIIVVVQFVVITKGATRMSEVAARFTLDAMPGKQMAIDADLSAGILEEHEARDRRQEITREADFYGAMDGASKFVRGDAIAGLIITLVNIIGGIAIGMAIKGWTFSETISVFTKLTIGDGLASQIPAFIVAIAAGLIVARAGERQTIGDEIPRQLASQPLALYLVAIFLAILAFTPLPTLPLLLASGGLAFIGWSRTRMDSRNGEQQEAEARAAASQEAPGEQAVEELLSMDALEIEIGYGLVQLVDTARGGDLLDRIAAIRRQLAVELGLVVPPVRIRDNVQLDASTYCVKLRGEIISSGVVHPNLLMAMAAGMAAEPIEGIAGREPAFDLDVVWIDQEQRARADMLGYTVVDAASVLATHLAELIRSHASELVTREEVGRLIEQLKSTSPKLVEEAVPAIVKPGELQKVLQNLLVERVPIRDLETIIETLTDWAPHSRDPAVLTEYVRNALRRTISHQHAIADEHGKLKLHCVTLDPATEQVISSHIDRSPAATTLTMPPDRAAYLASAVSSAAEPLVRAGHRIIVLASPNVRSQVRSVLEAHVPGVIVLAYNEVERDIDVESLGLVHMETESVAA